MDIRVALSSPLLSLGALVGLALLLDRPASAPRHSRACEPPRVVGRAGLVPEARPPASLPSFLRVR